MIKAKLTLIEEMLGTKAANANVFADFIASKAPDEDKRREEIKTAEHREEAGTTVFSRKDGAIGLWDYSVRGFFKEACGALNRCDADRRNGLEKLTAYKTKITGCIFVFPRFIPIHLPEGGKVGVCERPLRCETAQGPRVSVCRSESVPAGSFIEIQIDVLASELVPYVTLWLAYGQFKGLGQRRGDGWGRFTAEILK